MSGRQITSDNDLFNLLHYIIQNNINKINTILPCKIVKIKDDNTIDVQSLIKIVWDDGIQDQPPVLSNVLVSKLMGGNCIIDVELKVGDIGIVGFCQQDISASIKNKSIEPPNTKRQFSLSDGIWLSGILSEGNQANKILLSQNGDIDIEANNDINITANSNVNITANSKAVLSAGNQALGSVIDKLSDIVNSIITMTIPTPAGPTTPMITVNPNLLIELNQVKAALNSFK